MKNSITSFSAILTLCCCALFLQTASATTYTYTGNGTWTTAANWSPSYPGLTIGASDEVIISGTCSIGNPSVTVHGAFTNNGSMTITASWSLTIESTGTFVHNGTAATLDGTIFNYGSLSVNSGKTMNVSATGELRHRGVAANLYGTLNNDKTLEVQSGKTLTIQVGGTFHHNGNTLAIAGNLQNNGTITVSNGKTLNIASTGSFTHNGTSTALEGTISNSGNFSVSLGKTFDIGLTASFYNNNQVTSVSGTLIVNGYFVSGAGTAIASTGVIQIFGSLDDNGGFSNDGVLEVETNGYLNAYGGFTHNGTSASIAGSLIIGFANNNSVSAGKTLTFESSGSFNYFGNAFTLDGSITNAGSFTLYDFPFTIGNSGIFTNNGTLTGSSTFAQNGTFTNGATGVMAPGFSPGTLTFTGNFDLGSGKYNCEINGTAQGTNHDWLSVTGTATLTSSSQLLLVFGAAITNGTTFDVLTAGTVSGTFAGGNVTFSNTGAGNVTSVSVTYPGGNTVRVTAFSPLLPVELIDFQAKAVDEHVLLTWRTASEQNNKGFDIQRSPDGRTWDDLAFVPGAGTTTEANDYSFFDEKPTPTPLEGGRGVIYYRLRQTDFDGGEAFSKVVSVEGGTDWQSVLRVSPNPARQGMTSLHFSETPKSEAFLKIFDCTGRQVFSQKLELENDGQPVPVDLSACLPGIYLARLEHGGEVRTERLVVAR